MTPVEVIEGDGPVILSVPHSGTYVPADIQARLTERGRRLLDTDWHVDRLYEGLLAGTSLVRANFHRYVVDANRDPSGASLYPGQNTTGLVPLTDFEGEPLWLDPPGTEEIERRRLAWHQPYHSALARQLDRVRRRHGVAILYDCHSIRSRLPFLFKGVLPDFNIGTNGGASCDARIERAASAICADADGFTAVVNGRFRGGWTVRHYGRPRAGIHAIQMELAQSTYLAREAPPFDYSAEKAERVRRHLAKVLAAIADVTRELECRT